LGKKGAKRGVPIVRRRSNNGIGGEDQKMERVIFRKASLEATKPRATQKNKADRAKRKTLPTAT